MILFKNYRFNTAHQLITLIILAVGLNVNTLLNEYAIDDGVVFTENSLIEKGISGIPKILTTDLYYGFKLSQCELSESRYRPFSLVIFALEYQFFGKNPVVSHLINVLLFALLISILYYLLQKYVFREQHEYLAFITCLLFVVHPIHTEVIANVKSRDELFSFLFILLSLLFIIKYKQNHSIRDIITALLCFFLALLTKESAITFLAVVPILFYYFFNQSIKQSILRTLPLICVGIFYLGIRMLIIGNSHAATDLNVLNSPFLYATPSEAFATKVFILLKYIGLLLFPHPLSWDYGYNEIPYVKLISFQFMTSFMLLICLIGFAIFSFKKKSIFSFCIIYFFLTISVGTNFIIDLGAPLAERMLFQASLAFCIAVAVIFLKGYRRTKVIAPVMLIVIILIFSIKTIFRNSDWKNTETLNLADVNSAPNSLRVNQTALECYIVKANAETNPETKKQYYKKAVYHGERSIKIYPINPVLYMELGSAHLGLGEYFITADLWMKMYNMIPYAPEATYWREYLSKIFYTEGNGLQDQGKINDAVKYYKKATELSDKNIAAWFNLANCYSVLNTISLADKAFERVKQLDLNHEFIK